MKSPSRCSVTDICYADHEPQHPDEWERWTAAISRAVRARATLVTESGAGTDRTSPQRQLIHAHCQKRLAQQPRTHPRATPSPPPAGLA